MPFSERANFKHPRNASVLKSGNTDNKQGENNTGNNQQLLLSALKQRRLRDNPIESGQNMLPPSSEESDEIPLATPRATPASSINKKGHSSLSKINSILSIGEVEESNERDVSKMMSLWENRGAEQDRLRVVSFYDSGEEVKEPVPGQRSVSRSAGFKLTGSSAVEGEMEETKDYVVDSKFGGEPKLRRHSRSMVTTERRQSQPGVSLTLQTSSCAVEELVSRKELMPELMEHLNLGPRSKPALESKRDSGIVSSEGSSSPESTRRLSTSSNSSSTSTNFFGSERTTSTQRRLNNPYIRRASELDSKPMPTEPPAIILNSFPTSLTSRPKFSMTAASTNNASSYSRYASMLNSSKLSGSENLAMMNNQLRRSSDARAAELLAKYL